MHQSDIVQRKINNLCVMCGQPLEKSAKAHCKACDNNFKKVKHRHQLDNADAVYLAYKGKFTKVHDPIVKYCLGKLWEDKRCLMCGHTKEQFDTCKCNREITTEEALAFHSATSTSILKLVNRCNLDFVELSRHFRSERYLRTETVIEKAYGAGACLFCGMVHAGTSYRCGDCLGLLNAWRTAYVYDVEIDVKSLCFHYFLFSEDRLAKLERRCKFLK